MKKITFLLAAVLFLAGCTNVTMNEKLHDDLPDTGFSDEATALPEPPLQLTFAGYDSLGELKSMLEKDDESMDEYLREHNFLMNGLHTREDVKALFETIHGPYFPVIEKASPSSITIYPEWNEMTALYELDNGVVYVFRVSLVPDSAADNIQLFLSNNKGTLSEEMSRSKQETMIYSYANDSDKDDAILTFVIDARGVYVLARVSGEIDRSSIVDTLQAVDFISLDVAVK
jgi:hypothetical protein